MKTQPLRFWRFGLCWGLILLLTACGTPPAAPADPPPTIPPTIAPTKTPAPTTTVIIPSRTDSPITSNQWTTRSPMPTARTGSAAAVIDGKIYVVGGETAAGNPDITKRSQATNRLEMYDQTTDSWHEKTAMPTARQLLATAVVDGKLYAIGGYLPTLQQTNIVEAYDPQTDTWRRRADLRTPRNGHAAAVVEGKIYVFGGYGSTFLQTVEVYDPATDTWTQKGEMPTPRSNFGLSLLHNKIYVIGGATWNEQRQTAEELAIVEEYDPASDQWTSKTAMPTARAGLSSNVINQRIYAAGGGILVLENGLPTFKVFATVERYDPVTDRWTTGVDLPQPRLFQTSAVVADKLYVIGGFQDAALKPIATLAEFTPGSE